MKCVTCGCDTYTTETRQGGTAYVRRRKKCSVCGARFTTYEFDKDFVMGVAEILEGKKKADAGLLKMLPVFYNHENPVIGRPRADRKEDETKTADDHF